MRCLTKRQNRFIKQVELRFVDPDSDGYVEVTVVEFQTHTALGAWTLVTLDDADVIAQSRIAHYRRDAESGWATLPMNCGAEVHDFNLFTDGRESGAGYRVGNIGRITRTVSFRGGEAVFDTTLGFGSATPGRMQLAGTQPSTMVIEDEVDIEEIVPQLLKWARGKGFRG